MSSMTKTTEPLRIAEGFDQPRPDKIGNAYITLGLANPGEFFYENGLNLRAFLFGEWMGSTTASTGSRVPDSLDKRLGKNGRVPRVLQGRYGF